LISPEGYRGDGRKQLEFRHVHCDLNVFDYADGSCYLEMGNTKLFATVLGPRESAKKSETQLDRARVIVSLQLSPFSGSERRKHRNDRKNTEMEIVIRDTMESLIFTQLFPRCQIELLLQVTQVDGSLVSACLNACTLALMDAGIPMHDFLISLSAAYAHGIYVLDPCRSEESMTGSSSECVLSFLPRSGNVSTFLTSSRIPLAQLSGLLKDATQASSALHATFRSLALQHLQGSSEPNPNASMAMLLSSTAKDIENDIENENAMDVDIV
jgi:exosome complex component RRP41